MTTQQDTATRPPLALLLGELKRMNDRLSADTVPERPRLEDRPTSPDAESPLPAAASFSQLA